jgi:DNA mismatch repair protein MutL
VVRAVPAFLKSGPKQVLTDIINELQTLGHSTQTETIQERLYKLMACHGAVKAGDKLSHLEMEKLINELYATTNPLTCPHGRPVMVKITPEELAKRFMRQ